MAFLFFICCIFSFAQHLIPTADLYGSENTGYQKNEGTFTGKVIIKKSL
jgi:hypothetical protein